MGGIRTVSAPEHVIDEVIVSVSPITGLIGRGPERVVENVGIRKGPEYVADPRHKDKDHARAMAPSIVGCPAVKPSLAGRMGPTVSAGELGCKSPARRGLHRGVRARSRRLDSQLLLTRQITLLQVLVAL